MITPDKNQTNSLLQKYKQIATEKLDALHEAQIEFDGFATCYRKILRSSITESFCKKYGTDDGWLKIKSESNPEYDGVYFYENGDLVGKPYVYGNNESLDLWVKVTQLVLTKDGFRAKHVEPKYYSINFILGNSASKCDKPLFKVRNEKVSP